MASLPDKLGPFELQRRLGAGGMAETFVARKRGPAGFEQRVCIKRILPAYESDQDFVTSFLAEARTSATLRNANIVQVLDFGEHEGSHYLALELIDGLDLRGVMERDGVLDAELVMLIAADVGAALAYAHAGDDDHPTVIHRDVSPSNVLVSRNGEVKLTDFGIARVVGGALHTASGVIKGKIPYMPPEYIDGGQFDARGDLFALGVMLFELLHGFRPFDGDSELDTLRRIVAGDRKPFTAKVDSSVSSCVERLLAKDPNKRFADAREFLDALPTLHTHRARKRLAELVRARTQRAPDSHRAVESQQPWAPGAEHAHTLPVTPSKPLPTVPPLATQRLPSRKALLALAASTIVLVAVVVTALFRLPRGPVSASAAPVPALPEAPPAAKPTPPPAVPAEVEPAPVTAPAAAPVVPEVMPEVTPEAAPARERHARRAELNVVVLPFGEVWVDGKHVGLSPQRLKLAPGTHEVGVGEGRPRETRSINLAAGQREELIFKAPKR